MTLIPTETVEFFRTNGFAIVEDLLPPDELAVFAEAVVRAVTARKSADSRTLAEKSRYEQSFIQCQNLWEDFPDVRGLTFHPRVGQAAAELLEADAVRVWHDQALFKEPGGRETDAHQDQPYWPIAEPRTVTAWIPLEGATLASGVLGYLPGSHKIGMAKFVDIFSGKPEDLLQSPELAGIGPAFADVPKGAVAFHHGFTAHLANPNRTERMRAVHTVIFFADGCTRGSDRKHYSVDRAGIQVGEPIRSDVTPIAWPREPGDLPEPPPAMAVPDALRRLGVVPNREVSP